MKFRIIVVAIAAFVLAGCVSLPAVDESSGGYLAFPMKTTSQSNTRFYYGRAFTIYDAETDTEIDTISIWPENNKHVQFEGPMPVGDYYLGRYRTIVKNSPGRRFQYKPNPTKIHIPFTIEEDTITIPKDALSVEMITRGNDSYSTRFNIVRASFDVIQAVEHKIAEVDPDGNWAIRKE